MSQPPYGNQPPYGGQPNPGGSQSGWGQSDPAGQPGFGPPPTGPAPSYGQPPTVAQPSFGQPTQAYGQPAYGGGGGYGPPPGGPPSYGGGPGAPYGAPPPGKKNPLPFIIIGLVVLLIVGGVGLFFALDDDDPTPIATTSSQPAQTSADTDTTTEDTETPTEDTDTDSPSGDDPNFAESEVVAADFVQSMIGGDYDAALGALCEDGRDPSDGDGFADGQSLADDFFTEIGATTITDGQLVSVTSSGDSDRDVVTFDLETEVGTVGFEVQVLEEEIGADLTICGYDSL